MVFGFDGFDKKSLCKTIEILTKLEGLPRKACFLEYQ